MILQRLAEHYDRIHKQAQLPRPGRSLQDVSFCILLDDTGKFIDFEDVRWWDGKRWRPQTLEVPGGSKPTGDGFHPCFLWDHPEYLLGVSRNSGPASRATLAFKAFRDRHVSHQAKVDHPEFNAVCAFLTNWDPAHFEVYRTRLQHCLANFGVFRVQGRDHYVHEVVDEIRVARETKIVSGYCLVSGAFGGLARLHEPKIKGVEGAHTAGALLVSFNEPAFTSYSKEQGFNAPVSTAAMSKYTSALNALLKQRREVIGGLTLTWWTDGTPDAVDRLLDRILCSQEPITTDERPVVEPTNTSGPGGQPDHQAPANLPCLRYFVLGLDPNGAQLSVRLWRESSAADLAANLELYLQDMSMSSRAGAPGLRQVVAAMGNAERGTRGNLRGFESGYTSPAMIAQLISGILSGEAYPRFLLTLILQRIRSDGEVDQVRVCMLRAILARDAREAGRPEVIPFRLDPEFQGVAYLFGRFLACVEKLRSDRLDPNLAQRPRILNIAYACAGPRLALSRLLELRRSYLLRVPNESRTFYDQEIASAMISLSRLPQNFTATEQAVAVLGYFHQRQEWTINDDSYTFQEAASGCIVP